MTQSMDFLRASVGGAVLAFSVTLFLLLTGRTTGLSGMVSGFLPSTAGTRPRFGTFHFRLAYVSGLWHGGLIMLMLAPSSLSMGDEGLTWTGAAVSGLLVGFGTRLGNGCTSGHGLCGLSQLSPRSLVATLVFMTSGMATSTIVQSNGWMRGELSASDPVEEVQWGMLGLAAVLLLVALAIKKQQWRDTATSYVCGMLFAVGLAISGMTQRSKVIQFLAVSPAWDPSLLFVLGVGVALLTVVFQVVQRRGGNPLLDKLGPCQDVHDCFQYHTVARSALGNIDLELVIGSWLFGIGWGLSGICPGPALVMAATGIPKLLGGYLPSMLLGMSLGMGTKEALAHWRESKLALVTPASIPPAPTPDASRLRQSTLQSLTGQVEVSMGPDGTSG